MNRVVDYIQKHLADPLDLVELAGVACFSPFHFHRLFRGWMGEPLQAFVNRLRLERAAQLLVFDQFRSISEIGAECGFSSSGTFARAFKQGFGMPAGEWRKRKICETNRKSCEAGEDALPAFSKAVNPMIKTSLQVRVRRLAPETIAYIRHIGPYKGDTELFKRLFGRLFAWAGARGLMGAQPRYLSLFQDNPNLTPASRQRLEVALIVPPGTAPSGEVGIRRLEGGLYATARVHVLLEDYAGQWDALVGDWLPGSGYQPDNLPAMEFYLNNPEEDPEGRYDVEICLPVRPL
ncbi:MAG: AraC family transcriptional regulator [Acidobacteriota bacterium]|nr:AraC family transcriptional regulator [Acidobacteriota bacterium]